MTERPTFRKPASQSSYATPEELFYSLTAREHGYLRGPQQDALREFLQYGAASDVAFELPTGAGKTTIGLLIAEWSRRATKERAAFLTLTNQLAAQVISEAKALGIEVADLRGNKERRQRQEEAKFLAGSAIAISTYSNLFNVHPVISECHTIIFDDAHGGGEFAASMWTLRIRRNEENHVYCRLIDILGPCMSEGQQAAVIDPLESGQVEMVDLDIVFGTRSLLVDLLDELTPGSNLRFAWAEIRQSLHACHVFVSKDAISIRPYLSPTFSHPQFSSASRRIYLSATLGSVEDIKRAYGIGDIRVVRAAQNQDGRRFIFVPELCFDKAQSWMALSSIWQKIEPKRAVIISPSGWSAQAIGEDAELFMGGSFNLLSASNIEESLVPFTGNNHQILSLANRYDGLDLPDDDCRLLIINEAPRATNEIEANLSAVWKLGAILRWREATRLIQGMGRCTRNATDFAVIILMGQSLLNSATNKSLLSLLPPMIQSEIEWGKEQLRGGQLDPESFASMAAGIIADKEYRGGAEEAIVEYKNSFSPFSPGAVLEIAADEVVHAKAIWSGDFSRALELAKAIADKLSGSEMAGARAWWLYNAAVAARLSGNLNIELDCLKRAKSTSINSGWLDFLIRSRSSQPAMLTWDETQMAVAEQIWGVLEQLGWAGKNFAAFIDSLRSDLRRKDNHKLFHKGVVALGRLLGAKANAPSEQGDPDVIFNFADSTWICIEAKSEKDASGSGISKRDLLQAKGHVDWVKFNETSGRRGVAIVPLIIAPSGKVHPTAEPHAGDIFFMSTDDVASWAEEVIAALANIRAHFAGHDFLSVREPFLHSLINLKVDFSSTLARIRRSTLSA